MLILKAIHDLSGEKTVKEQIWDTYLTNKYAKDEKYRLKLKPIESDYVAWRNVIDGNTPINESSNLWKNYEFFKRRIDESECSVDEIFQDIGKLEIVYIQLEIGKENP